MTIGVYLTSNHINAYCISPMIGNLDEISAVIVGINDETYVSYQCQLPNTFLWWQNFVTSNSAENSAISSPALEGGGRPGGWGGG